MRILIAPDKFKDALSAREAAEAIQAGILEALPEASCTLLPLADGGEGSTALLTSYANGIMHKARVQGPLLQPVDAHWGFEPVKKSAFIELAEASGLRLLRHSERNPLNTTSYGTGELIAQALKAGARTITLGLGGSATNDGGCGMAAALGFRFYAANAKPIPQPAGKDLIHLQHIDADMVNPLLTGSRVKAACDVQNLLTGPSGATYTFAQQKGASDNDLPILEEGLCRLADLFATELGVQVKHIPGSGAAGGAGAGVLAFLGGSLQNGANLILEASGFREHLQKADILISGEGKIDESSLHGKLLASLRQEAKRSNKKLIVFCGSTSMTEAQLKASELEAIIPVSTGEEKLEMALKNTARNLQQAAARYFSKKKH